MPVLVLKAKAGSPAHLEKLIAEANAKATESDRVLVVYDKLAASIYYEGAVPPRPVRVGLS